MTSGPLQRFAAIGRTKPLMFGDTAPHRGEAEISAKEAVRAVYRQILRREADAAGLVNYAALLESGGITVRELVRELLLSEEWAIRFIDGRSVSEICVALYGCALSRAPNVESLNHLKAWEPRAGWPPIINSLIDSQEYAERFGTGTAPGTPLTFRASRVGDADGATVDESAAGD